MSTGKWTTLKMVSISRGVQQGCSATSSLGGHGQIFFKMRSAGDTEFH